MSKEVESTEVIVMAEPPFPEVDPPLHGKPFFERRLGPRFAARSLARLRRAAESATVEAAPYVSAKDVGLIVTELVSDAANLRDPVPDIAPSRHATRIALAHTAVGVLALVSDTQKHYVVDPGRQPQGTDPPLQDGLDEPGLLDRLLEREENIAIAMIGRTGYGLSVVTTLASAVGYTNRGRPGKTAWAELGTNEAA